MFYTLFSEDGRMLLSWAGGPVGWTDSTEEEQWPNLEDDDRSDKIDEDEEEVNHSGRMIFRAGRKKKEEVVGKPGPDKSEFEEAERSSEDGDGEDSLDEREVTIVNKPSSNILKNPFP
ncbi:hypothetical protein B9Z19DRAFT_1119728 [Tuber borchii]|uniref:Uncharacterized protein n=1 Tax=Tuber borchii TaxID=42251 RepID=A0A2T7A5W9_TUBBO|nr:hypothetical protein B9Z19DRAFT_1119728 [Tuber borchii]